MRTVESHPAVSTPTAYQGLNPSSEQPGHLAGQTTLVRSIRSVPHAVVNLETQEKARNLIREGDRELARQFAATLMERAASPSPQVPDNPTATTVSNIPRYSTFGQAWTRFTNALKAEPFATFARRNNIDTTKFRLDPNARWLECTVNGKPMLFTPYTPGWSHASAVVTAAARELVPTLRGAFKFDGEGSAPLGVVSDFYASAYGPTKADLFFAIGMLQQLDSFTSLLPPASDRAIHDSPLYQRTRQMQQETIETVALELGQLPQNLPPAQRNMTPAQRVDEADLSLAQACSRAMASWHNETRRRGAGRLDVAAPSKDSTFGAKWQAFENALSTDPFSNFARAKGIEVSSISIDPVSGTLSASVRGTRTDFSTSDASGWSAVAPQILDLARSLAAGSSDPLSHPRFHGPKVNQILNFYAEITPDTLQETLKQCAALNRAGFSALRKDNPATDEQSRAVQEKQNALKLELTHLGPRPAPEVQTPTPTVTRTSGDSELAVLVSDTMLALKQDNSTDASRVIANIPAHSAFGQWWAHITQAFEGRALTEWAQQQKVDLDTLVFDPAINALKAKANGVDRVFFIKDFAREYPELFDALTPLANAANVLVPFSQPIMIAKPSSPTAAPFALVFNFYGGNTGDLSSPGFIKLAHDMKRAKAFPDIPEDPQRSEAALQNQKAMLGNNNDRNALASRLKLALSGTQLDHTHIRVDSNSSHQPKGIRTAKEFIIDNGWKVPRNKDEITNLLLALRTPVPQREPLADLWGFLSTPVPLTTAQREQVAQVVKAQLGTSTGLFNYLAPTSDTLGADLKQNLEQLLSSDKAQALGRALQTQLKGFPTSTSISQWILTALVLELDPKADDKRNSIAGFDLMQTANWGRPANELLGKFTQHLTDTHKIGAAIAPTAAHVLLSGKAPQFLVKELPNTLIYGTPAWASFCTAINRIEQIAPGAAATMTFEQVMNVHRIKPISVAEERQLARAQMNPLVDWGIVNDVIVKSPDDEYNFDQLQRCQAQLTQQTTEVAAARSFLGTVPVPKRREMAIKNLTEKFGHDIPYETQALWRERRGTVNGVDASVAEAYEANDLGNYHWVASHSSGIPLQTLRDRHNELPDINAQFEEAINKDFPMRRGHSIAMLNNLLSTLPAQDRIGLTYGKLEYYSLSGRDTVDRDTRAVTKGISGRHGILLRSTHNSVTRDYAIYPDLARIDTLQGLPKPMIGHKTEATLFRLPVDLTAFSSATPPRSGVLSDVVVRAVEPRILENGNYINITQAIFSKDQSIPNAYSSEKFKEIAGTLVDSHFLRKEEYRALNRDHNVLEAPVPTPLQEINSLARMVPGVSGIEDVIQGNYVEAGKDFFIDAMTVLVPEGLGKLWGVSDEVLERAVADKTSDEVKGVTTESAETAVFQDVSAATAAQDGTRLGRLQNTDFSGDTGSLQQRSDVGNGAFKLPNDTHKKVTAVFQDGNWYAYDIQSKAAYGPPLESFVPDTSLPLVKVKGPDGTQVLTTQKPLTENAFVIDRPGYSDIIDGNKVYRFRPENPNVITDLESPESLVREEDFEAFCPAPTGRIKRGLNDLCFTRVIEASPSSHQQKLQAIDHQRLFPAPIRYNGTRTVVFERKLYNVVSTDAGETLKPHEFTSPIKYKDTIPGTTVPDKYFGFPDKNFDKKFEKETRIVRLGAISDISNDQRELRAIIVPTLNGSEKHLVVEADTGVFYHRKLTAPESTPFKKIEFKNNSSMANKLINGYTEMKEGYYSKLGAPKNNNFVALPPMDSIYIHLRAKGNSIEGIQKLKEGISSLTAEKQREFAMKVWNKGKTRDIDVALKPVRLPSLTKPNDFINFTKSEKNKYFAHEAKKTVDEQIAATGIGPANLRTLSNPADAERLKTSNSVTAWLYQKFDITPDSSFIDTVLKTGAGNCDQMAHSAARIIQKNGGRATVMGMPGKHAFTVVGDVNPYLKTSDFSEPAWKDLWISDPWAEIECPAPEYIKRFGEKMQEWKAKGQQILSNDGVWIDADDPEWIRGTVGSVKSFD